MLEAPKPIVNSSEKSDFIKSIRITSYKKKQKNTIELLVCPGDGLGIQPNLHG